MPNSNCLVMGEVHLSLGGEETVDLGLGGELRAEVLLVDLLIGHSFAGGLCLVHSIDSVDIII